ncbi:fimbrial protein [Lonsdalea iberica]|uniref:Fimbrial assembly protein n=1 Tax=Lonsdalea iberica TaxID=1082703 RepID=A0A1X3RS35_9GAMM|nr:fimbrial protein [Lonsdalea iberica]OSN04692.1 fimbrial assembly protein [Lonsdalea iberica]
MKLSNIAVAMAITVSSFSVMNVQATDSNNGTVTFKGEILDTPCSVSQEDLAQTIEFGEISKTELEGGGTSVVKPFDITLKDCSIETSTTAKVVFSGSTADGTENKLLALHGSAGGAGIAVLYSGEKVSFDGSTAAVSDYKLVEGDNTLSFTSYVQKLPTDKDVTTGDFESTANFVISYE